MAEDLPIVGVCIVAEPGKCPPNHILIDRTYNGSEEADLWKDGLFGRRVTRYLCLEKAVPAENQDVLVDVALTNEKDPVPAGFTVVEYTHDTNEKAIRKRCLCIRWMNPSMTNSAITDLVFTPKGTRRPPSGYTLVGEMNHLSLCYKMGKLPQLKIVQDGSAANLPYPMSGSAVINMTNVGSSLPYSINPASQAVRGIGDAQPATGVYKPQQTVNNLSAPGTNALSGIPWEFNAKFHNLSKLQNISIPVIKYKTIMDIENEYNYDFHIERSVKQAGRLPEGT
ncbi:multivesicular body subunit 12B-like [Gigantopelta aegis]|uniref:multivesicular body subunit 12B-like n=1 Tax=Gigantopelta aegis TaxID=1735272 RepID=UPI001B88C6C8|nr:multivesicular body subunit 12B-like [Gigantopelta aegis]